jgi:murein DD-endopeptidase MepM/ murein hydrolase activator NlpD
MHWQVRSSPQAFPWPPTRFLWLRSNPLNSLHNRLWRRAGLVTLFSLVLSAIIGFNGFPGFAQVGSPGGTTTTVAALWSRASFPVENFQTYTSPFGPRTDPFTGEVRNHYGLDLAAPLGSYIRNWWSGSVLWVTDEGACGTAIAIQSGDWTHIYCHMQGHVQQDGRGHFLTDREGGIQIWEGQPVPAGARIGRVGMTGRTNGPHLHWGLKYKGEWTDPAFVLRAMYASQRAAL